MKQINKKPSCRNGKPTVPPISECQRPTSDRGKKATLKSDCSTIHATAKLLYRTLQSKIGYNKIIWRAWVMTADSNFAFKIAAKRAKPLTSAHAKVSMVTTESL